MASESSTSVSESLPGSTMKQRSRDFADQIRQLELEGSKLIEATYTLSSSVITPSDVGKDNFSEPSASSSFSHKAANPTLSALTDISDEQKTIEDLRVNLDAQSRETERLQRSLAEPTFGLSRYPLTTRSSSLSALNLPQAATYSQDGLQDLGASGHTLSGFGVSSASAHSTSRLYDYSSQSQTNLERQVKDLQDEVSGLRNRLRQALSLGEEQKHSFRSAQEDLKRQMMSALANKDSMIEAKTRELSAQEAVVTRLQATVERQEQNHRLQEETLVELTGKCETSQKSQYVLDSLTTQLRKMVSERERHRGRPFSDTESYSTQNPSMLLHHIERYNTEMETEHEQNSLRLKQVTAELESLKSSSLERQHSSSRYHQDRLAEMAEAHEKELNQAVERSMQARSQVTTLQEQLSVLRQENSQRLAEKEDLISQLRREVDATKLAHGRDQEDWLQKKQSLEAAMDATQKEVGVLKRDHDEAIYLRAKLESKIDQLQRTVSELEQELKMQQAADEVNLREKAGVEQELSESSHRLEQTQQEVLRLKNIVQSAKLESNAQLQNAVATLEREEKEKTAGHLQSLTERLAETTDKLHQLSLQYEVLKSEHKNLQQRHTELESSHGETTRRAEAANAAKEQLTTSLQDQSTEIGRLSQEKDYYLKISEERGKEIGEMRVEMDKLAVQLEERQKNFALLKDQNDKINQLLENNSETTRGIREERDKLYEQLNTNISDAEQRKTTHEHLAKKLKIREKHLKDLQDDNHQMAELLATNKEELEQITREKDMLYQELKDSRYEVSALKETNTELERKLSESEDSLRKELEEVTKKLKTTESDLKIAKKAMKTKEHVDGKAVRVAGKMQREVTEKRGQIDSLQSKMRWLEECMENIAKEKKLLKHESEKLSLSLQKSISQNERLTVDLASMTSREKEARERMNKLEAALEKAAVKHAAAQAQVEHFEQDIARLKLKHQLEIKELARAGKVTPPTQHVEVSKATAVQTKPAKTTSPLTAAQTLATLQALTTQSPQTTATQEKPLSQSQQYQPTSQVLPATNGVGNELRELLHEMRSLIHNQNQPPPPQYKPTHSHTRDVPSHPANHHGCNNCHHTSPTTTRVDSVGQSKGKYTSSLHTADMRPTKLTTRAPSKPRSSHHKNYTTQPKRENYVVPKRESEDRYAIPSPSTSPVSDLLADTFSYKDVQDTVSSITGITDDADYKTPTLHTQSLRLPGDTNMLCKRLEKKLQKLSKLGSHLVAENQEIGEMMKNQDMELKKVRHQGKLLKA